MNASACLQTSQPLRKFTFAEAFRAPVTRAAHAPQCSTCSAREHCLPCGLDEEEAEHVDALVQVRKQLKRGESVYRAGDSFKALYAVRSGFLKTYAITQDGREQVTGFHMAGDVVGLDGIGTEFHNLNASALEDTSICIIPMDRIENISNLVPKLQRELHRMMSREIVRDQGLMMMLGCMRAEERAATFLLNLSHRLAQRGYSSTEFHLRMTREEIGSYLSLTIETISRIFKKFQDSGLLDVQQKHIQILDIERLRQMATVGTR